MRVTNDGCVVSVHVNFTQNVNNRLWYRQKDSAHDCFLDKYNNPNILYVN